MSLPNNTLCDKGQVLLRSVYFSVSYRSSHDLELHFYFSFIFSSLFSVKVSYIEPFTFSVFLYGKNTLTVRIIAINTSSYPAFISFIIKN